MRTLFREGRGINSSIAVFQDVTGKAEEKAVALGVAVGSGYLYKTTFEKEVYSDLYGERGCLMGGIHGMFLAQYEVLRERGHSPSEAFNETVEEATQSLYPLIAANGMDWMYAACSTTARRGAIDWSSRFKDTLKPVFNDLYDSVKSGKETTRSLEFNSQPDYREKYEQEMKEIRELEIWRAGKAVRYVVDMSCYTPRLLTILIGASDLRISRCGTLIDHLQDTRRWSKSCSCTPEQDGLVIRFSEIKSVSLPISVDDRLRRYPLQQWKSLLKYTTRPAFLPVCSLVVHIFPIRLPCAVSSSTYRSQFSLVHFNLRLDLQDLHVGRASQHHYPT